MCSSDLLGLDIGDWKPEEVIVPDTVKALLDQRDLARSEKNWARADELRDEILALGYVLEDTREGTKVSRA